MSTRKICPHYVKDKKCSYKEYCMEQLLSDEKVCTSKFYYAMSLEQQLDQLKAEKEELKKQLMQKSEVDMFFNTPIEGWSNDPCGVCKLKQTLTEIKEIADIINDRTMVASYICDHLDKILQKISEVLDE